MSSKEPGVSFWSSSSSSWRRKISWSALYADRGGAIYVEYVTLLIAVSLVAAAAIAAVGAPMVNTYRFAQYVLGAPLP